MPAYARVEDVQQRMLHSMSAAERQLCLSLLDDAGMLIDSRAAAAGNEIKKLVSCRMVVRVMDTADMSVPMGASQGSQGGLGYSESWTISGGSFGELYLSKADKSLLGIGNKIGASNPFAEEEEA